MVPTVGNDKAMTLKDYIKTGAINVPKLASHFGVSESGARKWVYGQRTPPLTVALQIVELSKGKVSLASLVKAA